MPLTFSEMERVTLLLELRKLVELKYSNEPDEDISNIDARILNMLDKIKNVEYYIW